MSTDAGQTGQQQQSTPLAEPEWYRTPPAWLRNPPPAATPPAATGGNSGDLVTAINAMPERVVNALTDAINGAQQRAAASGQQQGGQQGGQQQQQPPPAQSQQQEQQPSGAPSFRDWFLGDGTAGSGGTW